MSRIGKKPVPIPSGVTATLDGSAFSVKGPKGELSMTFVEEVLTQMTDDGLEVNPRDESKRSRAMWGMQRTLAANLVQGVSEGYTKRLEINGVGYRAQVQGRSLKLQLGLSHEVDYAIPEGIEVTCGRPTEIEISGIEKSRVGQVAAEIRRYRPPEPYKGKGIRYADEYVHRKEGKKK